MFTRNIQKDTATQVNSDKIGVLVNPDVATITVSDFALDTLTTAGSVMFMVEVGDKLMPYSTYEQYNEEYYSLSKVNSIQDSPAVLYYASEENLPPVPETVLYIKEGDDMVEYGTVDSIFTNSAVGSFTMYLTRPVAEGGLIPAIDMISGDKYLFDCSDSSLIDENEDIVGYMSLSESEGRWTGSFVEIDDEGYVKWSGIHSVAGDNFIAYTTNRNPQTGDSVWIEPEYGSWTVTSKTLDDISCGLSYSVNGITWTEHPTALTDDNNVICNIPRYLYLKFSQDVEITEP